MELPSTASEVAGRPSSRDRSGRTASRLLLLEAAVLALSLPVQVVYLMGQLWESPDAALLDRMTTAIIPLELAALVTGIISGCAGAAIRRGRTDAVALTITAAVLALVQSVGWVLVLRDALLDPPWARCGPSRRSCRSWLRPWRCQPVAARPESPGAPASTPPPPR